MPKICVILMGKSMLVRSRIYSIELIHSPSTFSENSLESKTKFIFT